MEHRARIPVTLPRANPTPAFWQDPPSRLADYRSTPELPAGVDTVIVGSGITGTSIAWRLLNEASPPKSILMLEARQICSGATGRNGGHTKAASYWSFPHNARNHSSHTAAQIARLELANIRAQHAFAAEHRIPCDSHPCRTVDVFYCPIAFHAALRAVKMLQDAMEPGCPEADYEVYSAEEVRERFLCGRGGDEGVVGGLGYEAGSLKAFGLVTGMLEMCLEKGGAKFNLQANTAVTKVSRRMSHGSVGEGWFVSTKRGTVAARRVVLATNAYTGFLDKRLQGVVVPLRGQITVQRKGGNMPATGPATTYTFLYKEGYDYMVSRPAGSSFEGDIVIGGGYPFADDQEGLLEYGTTDDTVLNPAVTGYLRDTTTRYFGDNWGEDDLQGRIRAEWTGIMGYTADEYPLVGEMPESPGLWVCCAFQGHGMVYCWKSAEGLVEMMQGRDNEELKSWFPDVFRVSNGRLQQKFEELPRLHDENDEAVEGADADKGK